MESYEISAPTFNSVQALITVYTFEWHGKWIMLQAKVHLAITNKVPGIVIDFTALVNSWHVQTETV
jgi:hypothetical protein